MSANEPDLQISFCIPVYNFGPFIETALNSIAENVSGQVSFEIIVLDGGSSDETPEILEAYAQKHPQLRYVRQEFRGGIDVDLNQAVYLARGEYCWLLSGDDTLRPGAVEEFVRLMHQKADVYLCEHNQCDFELQFLDEYPIFTDRSQITINLANPELRERYLANARNTEACFSFMSGLVVRRSVWLSVEPPEKFQGSCWWHVARLLECAKQSLEVCYVGSTWVDRRGGNDSFLDRGLVRRLGITVNGYQDLANHYFGIDSIEALHVRRLVRADLRLRYFLYAKLLAYENPDKEDRGDLDRLVRRAYSDMSPLCILSKLAYQLTPVLALSLVRPLWQRSARLLRSPAR